MQRSRSRSTAFTLVGAAALVFAGCAGSTGVNDDEGLGGSGATGAGGAQSGGAGLGGVGGAPMGGTGATAIGGSGAVTTGGYGAVATGGYGAVTTGGVGTGGQVVIGSCTDSDQVGLPMYGPPPSDPALRGTASGVNGVFSDECDAAGNLIEYTCEFVPVGQFCVAPASGAGSAAIPMPSCQWVTTGNVIPTNVDCGGGCVDGACESHCPEQGDQLRYDAIDAGSVTLQNVTAGRTYHCTVVFDAADTYGCAAPERLGTTVNVYSLGLTSQFCNAQDVGSMGTDDPAFATGQECTFQCTQGGFG